MSATRTQPRNIPEYIPLSLELVGKWWVSERASVIIALEYLVPTAWDSRSFPIFPYPDHSPFYSLISILNLDYSNNGWAGYRDRNSARIRELCCGKMARLSP